MTERDLPIPDARFYVVSEDTFMSGWGEAEGMRNWCVCPCDDSVTARRVAHYAKQRGDQIRVRVCRNKPRKRVDGFYSLVPGWVRAAERLS